MSKEIQLIKLYCAVCQGYYNITARDVQRLSNNFFPKFTDEESIAIYIFGIAQQKYEVKAIYDFIKEYYDEWFPDLPTYENFNRRICNLAEIFKKIAEYLLSEQEIDYENTLYLLDSMPIMVANNNRSSSAKAAKDICNKGYCASKDTYYYGVKLHYLGQKQYHTLPQLFIAWLSPASENDLTSAKKILGNVRNIDVFADKIYNDRVWQKYMREHHNVTLTTPVKLKKGQKTLDSAEKLYNSVVSSIRQPIESFFNWLQEKTNIQSASKVRSSNGLISFVFARLAAISLF